MTARRTTHPVRTSAPSESGERRSRNAEATRAQLLRAAQRRFVLLGYERTTTRDVAADVGVNVALINRYFGSKDQLFASVLSEFKSVLDGQPLSSSVSDMAEGMVASLDSDAWSEFGGEHPLLLLLDAGGEDDAVLGLRRRVLSEAIGRIGENFELIGGSASDPAQRLRAELALALTAGVILLRRALPDEPLSTADPALLHTELERVLHALLNPDSRRG